MLLFRDEEHIDRWCETRHAPGRDADTGTGLAARARLVQRQAEPEWRRQTLEEAETPIARVGLTGAFWNLRGKTDGLRQPQVAGPGLSVSR